MSTNRRNDGNQFKRRAPPKSFTRKNDVYLTNKTDFAAQLKKCIEILNDSGEVFLHSIGNAINRAINLALKLEEDYSFKYEVNTSTINLVDDHDPLNDEDDFSIRKRQNSCIHIRIYRPFSLTSSENKEQSEKPTEKLIKI
jgi:ribonuclease P/MRP protein subunit RPP20